MATPQPLHKTESLSQVRRPRMRYLNWSSMVVGQICCFRFVEMKVHPHFQTGLRSLGRRIQPYFNRNIYHMKHRKWFNLLKIQEQLLIKGHASQMHAICCGITVTTTETVGYYRVFVLSGKRACTMRRCLAGAWSFVQPSHSHPTEFDSLQLIKCCGCHEYSEVGTYYQLAWYN